MNGHPDKQNLPDSIIDFFFLILSIFQFPLKSPLHDPPLLTYMYAFQYVANNSL